jgi:hypothetical protein
MIATIRDAISEDAIEIDRLRRAQLARTPWWPKDPPKLPVQWRVKEVGGRLRGAIAFLFGGPGTELVAVDLWVDDGFAGRRAAVELSRDLEFIAGTYEAPLHFEIMLENTAIAQAIEEAGYEPYSKNYRKREVSCGGS